MLYYVFSTLQSNLENVRVGLLAQMAAQAGQGAAACVEERAEPMELQRHFAVFHERFLRLSFIESTPNAAGVLQVVCSNF